MLKNHNMHCHTTNIQHIKNPGKCPRWNKISFRLCATKKKKKNYETIYWQMVLVFITICLCIHMLNLI